MTRLVVGGAGVPPEESLLLHQTKRLDAGHGDTSGFPADQSSCDFSVRLSLKTISHDLSLMLHSAERHNSEVKPPGGLHWLGQL